jgi:pyridoxal phosphate enzyme (YggS family)
VLDAGQVAERAAVVRARIERAGGVNVGIVAVTKGFGADAIVAATQAGLTLIGENYAQEAEPKVAQARAAGAAFTVHFIGHLQSNKVRALARFVDVWETVDRAPVVAEIAKRAPGASVFVQVNATDEEAKGGCRLADVDEVVAGAVAAGLRVQGLMAIGPTDEDAERTRQAFRATRAAVDRLGLAQCSMGMSGDLEIAVDEGATLVRVGTALFGPRSSR